MGGRGRRKASKTQKRSPKPERTAGAPHGRREGELGTGPLGGARGRRHQGQVVLRHPPPTHKQPSAPTYDTLLTDAYFLRQPDLKEEAPASFFLEKAMWPSAGKVGFKSQNLGLSPISATEHWCVLEQLISGLEFYCSSLQWKEHDLLGRLSPPWQGSNEGSQQMVC